MLLIPRARAARPGLRVTVLRSRHTFRAWRGERPFWAGLFTFTAALPILYWPYASLDLGGIPLALSTTSGAGSLTIGVLLMTLGITLWYRAHLRVFAGITTLLLALISFPVANLGGLFLGVLLGLIGGSLACAWLPPAAAAGLADGAAANVTADVAEASPRTWPKASPQRCRRVTPAPLRAGRRAVTRVTCDDDTPRDGDGAGGEGGSIPAGRVRASVPRTARVPQPLACVLAVATVPLVLHLPTPRPGEPLSAHRPTAPVNVLAPSTSADAAPDPAPSPTGRATEAVTAPAFPGPRTTPTPGSGRSATAEPSATFPSPSLSATAPASASASVPASASASVPPSAEARSANGAWTLGASRLVLRALSFRGVVSVRTAAGTVRMMEFTARSVEAADLTLTAGRGRSALGLRARTGSTATLRNRDGGGVVTLYIRELSGTLTALDGAPLPSDRSVTAGPDAVPDWLAHPAAPAPTVTLADAAAAQLTHSGGTLSVPGAQLRAGPG